MVTAFHQELEPCLLKFGDPRFAGRSDFLACDHATIPACPVSERLANPHLTEKY